MLVFDVSKTTLEAPWNVVYAALDQEIAKEVKHSTDRTGRKNRSDFKANLFSEWTGKSLN